MEHIWDSNGPQLGLKRDSNGTQMELKWDLIETQTHLYQLAIWHWQLQLSIYAILASFLSTQFPYA